MRRYIAVILAAALLAVVFIPNTVHAEGAGRKIRVGWFSFDGVQEMHNGVPSGFNYDYLMELAKYNDWDYEFVSAGVADCLKMVANGEIDLVCSIAYSEERAQYLDFSDLVGGYSYYSLITKQDSSLEKNAFESYDGISIGVVANSSCLAPLEEFSTTKSFTYKTVLYPDFKAVTQAVESGEVDAGVTSALAYNDNIRVLSAFSLEPYYFVTGKGNSEILSELNSSLNKLKIDNFYFDMKLCDKYFPEITSLKFTEEEYAAIEASKTNPITVGVVDCCAPLCYVDNETQTYKGITIELLDVISEKTGLCMQYVPVDFSRRDEALTPNEASPQLLACSIKCSSLPDDRNWYYSDSIISDDFTIVSKQGVDITTNPSTKTLAMVEWMEMAKTYTDEYMPEYQTKTYSSLEECMDAVVTGEADAAIYLKTCANYILQKPRYKKLVTTSAPGNSVSLCIAGFVDTTQPTLSVVSKGIRMMSYEELRRIELNYTVLNPYSLTLTDTLYEYRVLLATISIMLVALISMFITMILMKYKSTHKIKEALALAEQASVAKGNFMSRMSHEIRTPLNAVIGYNTLARNELSEAKTEAELRNAGMKVMDCMNKSSIASRHLLTIINDVLDMSAIEHDKIKIVSERFDFKGLISSLTAVFYSQAKAKGVDFDVRFEDQMEEWLVGDQMRVNQILTNLLSNAIKFTPDGGNVILKIFPHTEESSVKVRFEVSDTGIGMEQDYLNRIWNPFEQADSSISRRFGGTGLGLSITKMLVDLMNGSIECESKPGKGSVFKVEIDFGRTEQAQEDDIYNFSDFRALVVDDDAFTCDYIRLLLTRSGISSASVTSGQEAVDAITKALEENNPYTICIVDWRMPKMDGIETVKQIRKVAGKDIPVIIITAYDYSEIAEQAEAAGVNMYLAKPLFQSSLMNSLANISGQKFGVKSSNAIKVNFSGQSVLLAEDNNMNMEIARKILETAGLKVDIVWNGKEAVEKYIASPEGTYQAILMDIQMPIMDGYEATQAIRSSEHPEAQTIPIIAMTADAFSENISESLAAGMNGHISKPIDVESMFETLKKFL